TADARVCRIRVLWEIPVRIIDLQQVMPHVADESGALPFAFELEKDVARRMAWRRVDLDEVVKPVRPATYQVGFAIFENRHDAFAESAQFGCFPPSDHHRSARNCARPVLKRPSGR